VKELGREKKVEKRMGWVMERKESEGREWRTGGTGRGKCRR